MRKTLLYILLISSGACCNNNRQHQTFATKSFRDSSSWHRIPESIVLHHLNILDSATRMVTRDTMYHCCWESIAFMEACRGIEADVDGDYAGATGFKKTIYKNGINGMKE
jgi:hypothetical protein